MKNIKNITSKFSINNSIKTNFNEKVKEYRVFP